MPPFFKLTLVVLCAYILWTFNHPDNHIEPQLQRRQQRGLYAGGPYAPARGAWAAGGAAAPVGPPVPDVSRSMQVDCSAGPSKNVAFLKTHKTGSSTMSNIMLRFADTHNLTVGLPLEGKWELGGYPAYIDANLIDPQLPTYNILGHHFRFNKEKLDKFMPADTKYVTIIRSPVDNVESVFGFFQDQMPFEEWLGDINATDRLKTFYANPTNYFKRDTDWYFRSKNHMFFDIGYDVMRQDEEAYVNSAIQSMDSHFTLILLTDFFDESLILMKHLLCWDWDDIVYIKFKMRIEEAKAEVNQDLSNRIQSWNHADTLLYDYFNKTFWQKVDAFGRDKMANELVDFQKQQKLAEEECIESYQPFKKKPWILGAKLRPHPTDKCKHLAWSETVYGEFLRDKMYKTIPGLVKQTEEQKTASLSLFEQVAGGALRSS
jgi:galactosylceramide sulfotransferase